MQHEFESMVKSTSDLMAPWQKFFETGSEVARKVVADVQEAQQTAMASVIEDNAQLADAMLKAGSDIDQQMKVQEQYWTKLNSTLTQAFDAQLTVFQRAWPQEMTVGEAVRAVSDEPKGATSASPAPKKRAAKRSPKKTASA